MNILFMPIFKIIFFMGNSLNGLDMIEGKRMNGDNMIKG